MARRSRQTILKRQRERKKAEKAEIKREQRAQRKDADTDGSAVASRDDLAAYGLLSEDEAETEGESEDEPRG